MKNVPPGYTSQIRKYVWSRSMGLVKKIRNRASAGKVRKADIRS